MRILITNDDGINAPGLEVLAAIAAEIAGPGGEVWTVAPAFEQSGVAHCISYTHPMMITQFAPRRFVEGTHRFRVESINLRIAIAHGIETAFVLDATEHQILNERGVPAKPEHRHLEVVRFRELLDQRGKFQCSWHGIHADGAPRILHVGDLLLVRWRPGAVDQFKGERLTVLFEDSVAIAIAPTRFGQKRSRTVPISGAPTLRTT